MTESGFPYLSMLFRTYLLNEANGCWLLPKTTLTIKQITREAHRTGLAHRKCHTNVSLHALQMQALGQREVHRGYLL